MQCPICGAILEQDFGVTACTTCQSVLFVDMDGNVQVSETSSAEDNMDQPPLDPSSVDPYQSAAVFPEDPIVPAETANFSDVIEFANSEKGPLTYTVTIENIDTKEIRENLIEAMTDPKFQWELRELKEKIKKGKLELKNLNPAKASVLVNKARHLPVKIRWKQDVY